MQSKIEIRNILPDINLTCFVVPSLFSQSECQNLLTPDIKHSFQKAISNYPTYYRNNERYVIDNDVLADQLFDKVKEYIPKIINTQSTISTENGLWHLKELNNRLRFCKYSANQYFHRHLDGVHYRNKTTQSKLTFMIYLNNSTDFEGGRTLFYKSKTSKTIWASYIPKQGDLIVFDHNVWHEGEVLTQGEKYVLRSDILYYKKEEEISSVPFEGHLGYIWSLLKFDNDTILSGGRDKEIKVWNYLGKKSLSLRGHKSSILSIEKLDDNVFISGSRDKQIIVWENFKIKSRINIHSAIVLSLCRLDKNTFASSSGDNTIKISNINGNVLKTLEGHTNWVWKVVKLNDNIIATSSEDKTIKIWNYKSGAMISSICANASIISLAYVQQTKQLVSGDLNGMIRIRTLSDDFQQKGILEFQAHNGLIRTVRVIDQDTFATGGEDNKVKIWKADGQLIHEFNHHNFVQSIELLNEKTIISASYDGTIKTWNI